MTNPFTILVTDDNPENRYYISQILRSIIKNAHFQEAENGQEAVDAVAAQLKHTGSPFRLIIMDFKMPVMNGSDATTAIRKLEQAAKLSSKSIIITWSSAKHSAYRDADDWLPKITNPSEVRAMLAQYGLFE